MFIVDCPNCGKEVQVPNNLGGCLVRCYECDGVLRAPDPELADEQSGETKYGIKPPAEKPHFSPEVQAFVAAMEKKAEEEAAKKPYRQRMQFPVDLILGLILILGGLGLMLSTFMGGGGGVGSFLFGILLPMMLIIMGAMCLMVWRSPK